MPGSVVGWLPFFVLRLGGKYSPGGLPGQMGWVLLGVGAATFAWCAWEFARRGRGTPGPHDPPRKLVVSGLYRVTRNPMYIGVMAVLLGEALLFPGATRLAYAIIVFTAFHLFVITFEEPVLKRRFGKPYLRYKQRVGRWL
ncbi:isoprenylcysteine carboxylmethyltransferase family protein [Candidatus Sumerlaeota bacterium]|nr:isoprenylcysteine carboxylmethyltransferase family protein [Candidatus Sumerlaeota bacterium]